jgi:DNA-binding HxlR family transcriptional regulator
MTASEDGMQWSELANESCSFARTMAIIGDRWTLMILRECFLRVRRFDDFQSRLGIGRPILTDRLNKLVDAFVLTKVAYQQNPTRYEYRLTDKGLDLYPVILGIVHFGDIHMAGRKGRPVVHEHRACGHLFDPVTICSHCEAPVAAREVRTLAGPGMPRGESLPFDGSGRANAASKPAPARRRRAAGA